MCEDVYYWVVYGGRELEVSLVIVIGEGRGKIR